MHRAITLALLLSICVFSYSRTVAMPIAVHNPDFMLKLSSDSVHIVLEETLVLGIESVTGPALISIPDTAVPLASHPKQPELNQVFASLDYPSCNLQEDIYYGLTPQVLDDFKGIGLWVQQHDVYNAKPGEGKLSVIGGHNYYDFNKLQYSRLGDDFRITDANGTWTYRVVLADFGDWDGQANILVNGVPVIDWKFNNTTEQVVLYTCYPFDLVLTNQRFVVIGELESFQQNS